MSDSSFNKWLQNAREKYEQSRKCVEESQNDSPTEPYKSKYKAIEILRSMESDVNVCEFNSTGYSWSVQLLSALINYELGVLYLETEEFSSGCDCLKRCWEIIKDESSKPECILLSISVLNQLGILASGRSELEKACEYLKQAEVLYGEYKLSKKPCPLAFEDLFSPVLRESAQNNDWKPLEKALTHTLYYLAQVYEHLGENEASAKYCHITLKRQLDSSDYDPLDWAVNCATLSQYFIAKEKFNVGRHVLSCATYMICSHEGKLQAELENAEEDKWEMFNRGKADVYRCWSKYCVYLLVTSRDRSLKESDDEKNECDKEKSSEADKVYRLLKETQVAEIEEKVTCQFVADYDSARKVFLYGQDCLNQAKNFYALNEHTYDYVQILQDSSKLYKMLAFYETDVDRQCKMHKRRADMLEEILKKLNPQYYLALCRQLMYELAEICSEMMDLKMYAVNSKLHPVSPHAVKKINMLANRSITHYGEFIETLTGTDGVFPETFADDVVRPALVAYFRLGSLYSKIRVSETAKQLEYLSKSEECYKFLVNYIEKNPQHEKVIKEELEVVKDMVSLIPGKMQALVTSN